jgi:hypothetical protein
MMILSGILDHQTASVVDGCQSQGLVLMEELALDDCRALVFSRK